MAKWRASETAVRVTDRVVQALGGYGYIREDPIERHLRDARLMTIGKNISKIERLDSAGSIPGRIGA